FSESSFHYFVAVVARFCSVLGGTGAILLTYFLGKDIYEENRALLASLFLCVLPYHSHNSSFATTDVLTSFFLTLFLFVLGRAFLRPKDVFLHVLAGAVLGILVGTKYTGAM